MDQNKLNRTGITEWTELDRYNQNGPNKPKCFASAFRCMLNIDIYFMPLFLFLFIFDQYKIDVSFLF